MTPTVLDLFSAAAGGWSLGMHRAGFRTVAACEAVDWRRALFAQNNPGVKIYDDVRTLTAARLIRDLAWLPDVVVGSPPCQDISSANTKGKGVDGERSGLYFEAIRIIGECRPRWFSLENSANLRTRGADRVVAAIQAIGYTVEISVVGADHVGANHERKRSWLVGCDLHQVTDARSWEQWQQSGWWHGTRRSSPLLDRDNDTSVLSANAHGLGRHEGWSGWRRGVDLSLQDDTEHAEGVRCEGGRAWRHGPDGDCASPAASSARDVAYTDQAGQEDGCLVAGLRQAEIPDDGRCDERGDDVADANRDGEPDCAVDAEMGGRSSFGGNAPEPWADWNGGLAGHLRVDDGVSARVAGTRVAIGGPRGTAAASLIVEAFGDAVVPQITEAIGRSILRTDAALRAIYGRTTPSVSPHHEGTP
jgi:DNA (cytosine-5)-methyltransferase 1